jgi:hypothetical protein
MNKTEVVIIALKLLGIYILVLGLASIATSTGINGLSGFSNWSLYFGTFIYLASGFMLIYKGESISKLIFRPSEDIVERLEISQNFQKGALRIIGIYVAIFALPALIHIAGQIIEYEVMSSDLPRYLQQKPNYIVPLVSQAVRFLLGTFLALGPNSVIKALSKFDTTIEKMGT